MVQTVSIPVRYQLELFQDARGTKMNRYIDADKIELSWYVPDVGYLADYQKRHNDMATFAQRVIDSAKTEDVSPVVHAHWRWMPNYDVICTKCQYVLPSGSPVSDFRFCPYCGAKMDEEV